MVAPGGDLQLVVPPVLREIYSRRWRELDPLLYRPARPAEDGRTAPSLEWALGVMESGHDAPPPNLLPLLPVDDDSLACLVCSMSEEPDVDGVGSVVRWHLGKIPTRFQGALLDVDPLLYAESVEEELRARPEGLRRMLNEIGPAYDRQYLQRDKRPRDFIVRPVRLACQNVIIGLAALAEDASIDGLSVVAWQTCEAPHVATHEGNRAMAALMLCDAFKNGGTMEIRFDQRASVREATSESVAAIGPFNYSGHPERRVPASLRRFGRSVKLDLGVEDPGAISPAEARELFLAVTPMPTELRGRIMDAAARGVASPERLCFTLMSSNLWSEIELDYILAVSDRAESILRGGSSWQFRGDRQAEAAISQSALMLGMLFRRLDSTDPAGSDGTTRVIEDSRVGITWTVDEDCGVVRFSNLGAEPLPWQPDARLTLREDEELVVVPRGLPSSEDVRLVRSLQTPGRVAALAVPADANDRAMNTAEGVDCTGIVVLQCPDRLGELNQAIEAKLLTLRIVRQ